MKIDEIRDTLRVPRSTYNHWVSFRDSQSVERMMLSVSNLENRPDIGKSFDNIIIAHRVMDPFETII